MNFSRKILKKISKYFAIAPNKINRTIHNSKNPSSKLKEVLKELSKKHLENFIWLSILKPNSRFDSCTLSALRNISKKESEETLHQLSKKSLIIQDQKKDQYYLHESLRVFSEQLLTSTNSQSYSIPRLGITWTDAQQKLLLEIQKNSDKFNLESDIYFTKNIAWHIHEAGWQSKIHSIINSLFPLDHWKGQVAQLVINENSEIDELFSRAENEAKSHFATHQNETLIELSKYGLMRNTQRMLLESIPEQWVKRLIKGNIWSCHQGLLYVLNQSDITRKADSIALLAPLLIPKYTSVLLDEVEGLTTDLAKATAIKGIFSQLQVKEKKIALELIKTLQCESYQAQCISSIAQHIPLTLMQQTYIIIEEMKDEVEQAKALSAYLPFCTTPIKKQCLNLIQEYSDLHQKVRLLNQLKTSFPELKVQIIDLAKDIKPDYTTASILWSLLNQEDQTTETILDWLGGEMSTLDKVLFLSERISEANDQQIRDLWASICQKEKWSRITGTGSSEQDESNWANVILGCISFLASDKIHELIQEIASLHSPEIKGELCLQILPFIEKPEKFDEIHHIIQCISDIDSRLKILSQALDYLPQAKAEISELLSKVSDPITKLEIQTYILESEPETALFLIQNLKNVEDHAVRFYFLRQSLDLIPHKDLSAAVDAIFSLSIFEQRNELLNIIEKRLNDQAIEQLIHHLNAQIYPNDLLKNAAKQIYRLYWESGTHQDKTKLPDTLLSQLPRTQQNSTCTNEVISEILAISNVSSRSKVLSLYLQEIEWSRLETSQVLAILETLSHGIPQRFIENFPVIAQGITQAYDFESLPSYGYLCEQLGDSCSEATLAINLQNMENTYRTFESPEFFPRTA